jgi:uncharacterized protein
MFPVGNSNMVKRNDWQSHHESYLKFDHFVDFTTPRTIAYVLGQAVILWLVGSPSFLITAYLFIIIADFVSFAALRPLGLSYGNVSPSVVLLSTLRLVITLTLLLFGVPPVVVILVLTAIFAASLYGHYIEPFWLEVNHIYVNAGGCSGSTPLKIVHISDIHMERITSREIKVTEIIDELKPDVIVMTGDYLNHSYKSDPVAHRHFQDFINSLPKTRYGTFASFGTPHIDLPEFRDTLFKELPVTVLDGTRHDIEHNGCAYSLVGVTTSRDFDNDLSKIDSAFQGADENAVKILLYHTPEIPEDAAERKIDLYLAGHTHGGQLALPFYGAIVTHCDYGKRFERGLNKVGDTYIYTNRGIGFEGMSAPRARFCSRPEIAVFYI